MRHLSNASAAPRLPAQRQRRWKWPNRGHAARSTQRYTSSWFKNHMFDKHTWFLCLGSVRWPKSWCWPHCAITLAATQARLSSHKIACDNEIAVVLATYVAGRTESRQGVVPNRFRHTSFERIRRNSAPSIVSANTTYLRHGMCVCVSISCRWRTWQAATKPW